MMNMEHQSGKVNLTGFKFSDYENFTIRTTSGRLNHPKCPSCKHKLVDDPFTVQTPYLLYCKRCDDMYYPRSLLFYKTGAVVRRIRERSRTYNRGPTPEELERERRFKVAPCCILPLYDKEKLVPDQAFLEYYRELRKSFS